MEIAEKLAQADVIIDRLNVAGWKERDAVAGELLAFVKSHATPSLLEHLVSRKKTLKLEVRWEIEEILEAMEPEEEPEEAPEEEEAEEEETAYDPTAPVTQADLILIYEDPQRGLAMFKHRQADRRFAAQPNPATGQMQMFELQSQEYEQLKQRLANSPFWVPGAGGQSE
jgi:hypothetical protein